MNSSTEDSIAQPSLNNEQDSGNKEIISSQAEVEDIQSSNSRHDSVSSDGMENPHPVQKDEYMEDPLPDLVGNLKISEEPEPDLTNFDQEFVLEDFEFNISTSDEDDEEDSCDSDLEFFEVDNNDTHGDLGCGHSLLPENENVSVELDHNFSINNGDVPSTSTGAVSKLANVRMTAKKVAASVKGIVGRRKNKDIRVLYHNLDKPYTARVSPSQHFKKFLTLGQEPNAIGGSMSQSSSINDLGSPIDMGMTREELEAARADWQGELTQVEDEIQTLRQVLNAKTRRAHELKRKLGVTVWGEFTSDMGQGIKNVRESNAVQKMEETISTVTTAVTSAPLYQKTESAIKATAEKTTSLFGGIGSAMSQKLGALKNTESFRSMEERVSSAVSTVKTKIGGSRSGSVQSFDDALREATANQGGNPDGSRPNGTPTPVATPVVEEKPIS